MIHTIHAFYYYKNDRKEEQNGNINRENRL